LREEIQRGGFGIVYKAYRIKDGMPVAVKYVEHKHVREWTMVGFLVMEFVEFAGGISGLLTLSGKF
jgi:serine/threonine protein kinase